MSQDCGSVVGSQVGFTFAQIPLAMRMDPDLKLADIAVTMFILPWVDVQGVGWTSVGLISRGANISERSVQESLARLRKAGWFAERSSRRNRTGREFLALWMTTEGFTMLCDKLGIGEWEHVPRLTYVITRVVDPPATQSAVRDFAPKVQDQANVLSNYSEDTLIESDSENTQNDPVTVDPELLRLRRTIPFLEPARIAGKKTDRRFLDAVIASNARIASKLLFDEHSFDWHRKVIRSIVAGTLPAETYLKAITITLRDVAPKDVDNMGAYFNTTLMAVWVRRTDAEFDEEWIDQRTPLMGVAS